jgi:ADP-ribose pyrophosphatase YjhB (NUDIX family)
MLTNIGQVGFSTDNNCLNDNDKIFCVKTDLDVSGYNNFMYNYRKLIKCDLGGTKPPKYKYNNVTIEKVLSVGNRDNTLSLPNRVSISNFKIGMPIISYGIIYRYDNIIPEYLLIKRNNSLSYIDLLQGSYRESQLYFMIQELPHDERKRLISYDFDRLWGDISMMVETELYKVAKEKFSTLKPHLKRLFEMVPSSDPDGKKLWLFPKGRPDYIADENTLVPEDPLKCAIREFTEETNGLSLENAVPILSNPIIEQNVGSNSKNYQTNYFVYQTSIKNEIKQFSKMNTGIREITQEEVNDIRWVSILDLRNFLTEERLELVNFVENNKNITKINKFWNQQLKLDYF